MPEEMPLIEYLKAYDPARNKYFIHENFLVAGGGLFGLDLTKLDEATRNDICDYYGNTFVMPEGRLFSTDCLKDLSIMVF